MTSTLRVLPLGGLGEIGKNMTVVEYEDRIVVVDTGLRFPTADMLVDVLDMGEAGGILTGSHIFGEEMRRMVDEPENRRQIDAGLQDVYRDMAIAPAACSNKAALNMIGVPAGKPRLPYVELDADEQAVVRAMLERHGMLAAAA